MCDQLSTVSTQVSSKKNDLEGTVNDVVSNLSNAMEHGNIYINKINY
jgi:hypothetical protein